MPSRALPPRRTPTLSRRRLLSAAGAVAGGLAGGLLAGCEGGAAEVGLRIMVPNAPGGGYDTTARVVAQVLEDEELTGHVDVFNVEGASGAVGLARTAHERGDDDLLMMMGLGVVGALSATEASVSLADVTPVARLISEPEIIATSADSPFSSMDALLERWSADPGAVRVGGGSSPGGPDHLAAHLLAQAAGIAPVAVRYTQYDGGGPLLAALFSGQVDVAVSGVGEYAGQVRNRELSVLAVTSEEHVAGLEAPTLSELGVPLEFSNWRGLVAPPGLSRDGHERLVRLIADLHDTEAWHRAGADNGWTDDFLAGAEFAAFLSHESDRVAQVLGALGLLPA